MSDVASLVVAGAILLGGVWLIRWLKRREARLMKRAKLEERLKMISTLHPISLWVIVSVWPAKILTLWPWAAKVDSLAKASRANRKRPPRARMAERADGQS